MLKNLFRIPDTFDPDDRRRRQVLNILLIVFIIIDLLLIFITLLFYDYSYSSANNGEPLVGVLILAIVIFGILLIANRLPGIPGWVSAIFFEAFLIFIMTHADTAYELYNGRSLVIWALPIMVSAVILRPEFVFLVTGVIFGLMQFFTPPEAGGVNYYAMTSLAVIALNSWLGMSIANRALQDARHHAANLQAIFDNVADGVLVLDVQGNYLSANPALLKMIPEEHLKEMSSKPLGKNVQWKRRIFSVTSSPVPDVGEVALFRDETRRRETERAKEALLATASHELRTPLAAVMNYLELLLMLSKAGKVKTEEFASHLTRALDNCKRLQNLVNDILDQAQIEAGVLELKHTSFDLRILLEKARQLLSVLIKEKDLSYELAIAPDVPAKIAGDPDRLYQVLVNLLGNAIKFTDQGGIKVKVSASQKRGLSIEVADSGPGIPPEQLPDIFEAFRRGSNYAQRERQGAGLGLSIAREIVARMGGEILAASELGTGSTFTVILPLEAA